MFGSKAIRVRSEERKARPGVETDHRGEIAHGDLPEANDDRSLRRGKTVASAGEARSGAGRRTADAVAERIREKRDNNLYRRELDGLGDKGQQDRRSAQRDVEEEADGSRSVAGKRSRDVEDTADAGVKENGTKWDRRGDPYRQRRAEERGTRLLDNGVRRIGRFDRVVKKNVAKISTREPAKRREMPRDGNGRRDRHEEADLPTARGDRKEVEEDKDRLEETIPSKRKKATASLDEESKLFENGGKREDTTADAGRNPHWMEKRRGEIGKNSDLFGKSVDRIRVENGSLRLTEIVLDTGLNDTTRSIPVSRFLATGNSCFADSSNSIKYQLSNALFVELSWTLLPITKIMRKTVRYEARPAKPYLDWFKTRRDKGTEYYDDARTPFLKFHPDGSGELFYPNGVLAVRVRRPENRDYDMYTVFTPGGKDALAVERGSQILAIFDTMGHGVVFDEDSAARLSYNQTGGIFTDSPVGLPLVWTWNANPRESILEAVYTERSTGRLQTEFFPELVQSSGNVKTPVSPCSSRNKKKKVAKVQKPVVEERQEEVGSKSRIKKDFPEEDIFHIRIICLRLNEFLSLRIVDRRNISLRFAAKNKIIRIELGTILDFDKETSYCMVEATDWKSDMLRCRFQDKLSMRLKPDSSLYDLAKEYQKVKKIAKQRKNMIARYKPFSNKSDIFAS
ncbi:uncharacterized protein LOC116840380 [Odontomachus brunneus]|uniref:uncharacterized protein LOC116840380 n=1 Tax=Odontomachus brunneus TaxID=486640 RepID=UPI0013F1F82C|nr:uncharacterized protein LOC116840380 [Odontomachus brunneus]